MTEHTKLTFITKPCSIPGQYILVDKETNGDKLSLQMPIEIAAFIVRDHNSHDALVAACETSAKCYRKLAGIGMLSSSKAVLIDNAEIIEAALKLAKGE